MQDTGQSVVTQMPTVSGNFTDLRKSIAKIVDESVPPNKHVTIFAIGAMRDGEFHGRQGVAIRTKNGWDIVGDLRQDAALGHKTHVTGQVMIGRSW